jgi:hypothetical protein
MVMPERDRPGKIAIPCARPTSTQSNPDPDRAFKGLHGHPSQGEGDDRGCGCAHEQQAEEPTATGTLKPFGNLVALVPHDREGGAGVKQRVKNHSRLLEARDQHLRQCQMA